MSQEWIEFLAKIKQKLSELADDGCDYPVFRGQGNSTWSLTPSLLRLKDKDPSIDLERLEGSLYFDFVTYSAKLFTFSSSWECLAEMRHHGVPTRLLDWSENLGTALYFALQSKDNSSPTVWLLNPYALNKKSYGNESLINPITLKGFDYSELYLEENDRLAVTALFYGEPSHIDIDNAPFETPLAIVFPLKSDRLFAQKGLFTLQGRSLTPLDLHNEVNECVTKFELPQNAIRDAHDFLKLAGVNEFSIYPDLDGLSRYLKIANNIADE